MRDSFLPFNICSPRIFDRQFVLELSNTQCTWVFLVIDRVIRLPELFMGRLVHGADLLTLIHIRFASPLPFLVCRGLFAKC